MWTLSLQAVVICVFLQVPGCFPSCRIIGSIADCTFQNLSWIPPLPPNITHLYLEMNHIGEINSSSLSGLEKLQALNLRSPESTACNQEQHIQRSKTSEEG
ncbi:hypothetical protein GBF38_006148 [Nibea albiflora]|uniref:Uncharacterized protein n=1 Tax=Nibea albiflora TaxID=240163 RepID=A0ACB7FBV0_NIBAL|nr:hypothetical protein GBF38_006148 [Nibea albiflora]